MAIYKADVCNQFTQIPNETLQDKKISFEAKGLLAMILSLPPDWEIHKKWLQEQAPNCGRDKLTKLIKELTEAGYMIKKAKQDDSGKMTGYDWFVYPSNTLQPSESSGLTGVLKTRRPDNPASGETTTTNKHKKNKQVSESTARARDFSAEQSENFADKVMSELLTSNLPERKHRYAQLKIKEFQERFPESGSVADCYSYVEQAVIHQIGLTGN